jgi:hypothetical protein
MQNQRRVYELQTVIGRLIVYFFVFGFWALTFAFTIYLLGRMCTEGVGLRPERRVGIPREEGFTLANEEYRLGWQSCQHTFPLGHATYLVNHTPPDTGRNGRLRPPQKIHESA